MSFESKKLDKRVTMAARHVAVCAEQYSQISVNTVG